MKWINSLYPVTANLSGHSKYLSAVALLLIVAFTALIYWPGIDGPFLFDDIANILTNDYLRISDLSFASLKNAAFSSEAGPLSRPIPVVSFALTFYLNDGSANAFPFKLANVLIHGLNGFLLFCFFKLGLSRLASTDPNFSALKQSEIIYFSFAAALLWVASPIHLTSVLYVVQRMASLSATFVLMALISYMAGRKRWIDGKKITGSIFGVGGTLFFGCLGLFSKENALLLPVYIFLLEIILFRYEFPLVLWDRWKRRTRYLAVALAIALLVAVSGYLVSYFLPGYDNRFFSFTERVLSQPRILLFYLSLIFLPRVDKFGVFHDDIPLSSGLLNPWTTLPSIIMVIALLVTALASIRKYKIVSFGILWFFASHLMESTIIALEPVHEHRNYLAAAGPVVVIVYFSYLAVRATRRWSLWALPLLFIILFSINTSLRAWHWSDAASLHDFEARNHPNSARAQASFGSMLAEARKYEDAKTAFLRAARLRPYEVADLINVRIILAWQKEMPSTKLTQDILDRVEHGLMTPLTSQVLEYAVNCSALDCASLQDDLMVWLPIYISRADTPPRYVAHYNYLYAQVLLLKNRKEDAIAALKRAISVYRRHLHPHFLLTGIYLRTGEIDKAEQALTGLVKANQGNPHPRDREIIKLSDRIQSLKNQSAR